MRRSLLIARCIFAAFVLPCYATAAENLQTMSDDELAEYFMVKECAADLYVVCTDRSTVKQRYKTPDIRQNASAINQKLELELLREEVDKAVNQEGLDPSEAHHGHMVKSCGIFSCSWEYKK
jgi:hypothetical protein